MEKTPGASSSLRVRAKHRQILVRSEWYANCSQMAQRSTGSQSHPHIRTFGSQTICHARVYKALDGIILKSDLIKFVVEPCALPMRLIIPSTPSPGMCTYQQLIHTQYPIVLEGRKYLITLLLNSRGGGACSQ